MRLLKIISVYRNLRLWQAEILSALATIYHIMTMKGDVGRQPVIAEIVALTSVQRSS